MENLISIIVPVYNVENYLENCVKSIMNQTYSNLEIILVDDGSKDKSGKICDELSKKDKRIIVVHKSNGGLSSARNAGIDIASGQYISFIDSDDYINVDFINKLYFNLINTGSDISAIGIKYVYDLNNDINEKLNGSISTSSGIEKFYNIYNNKAFPTVVAWNKLYKKKIFDNLRYKEGILHEDEELVHKILNNCNKIVYDDSKAYYYLQRNNSIMGQYKIKRLDIVKILEDRIAYFDTLNENELVDIAKYYYLTVLTINYSQITKQIDNYKSYLNMLKDKINTTYKDVKKSKYLGMVQKLKLFLCKFFPKTTYYFFKLKLKYKEK